MSSCATPRIVNCPRWHRRAFVGINGKPWNEPGPVHALDLPNNVALCKYARYAARRSVSGVPQSTVETFLMCWRGPRSPWRKTMRTPFKLHDLTFNIPVTHQNHVMYDVIYVFSLYLHLLVSYFVAHCKSERFCAFLHQFPDVETDLIWLWLLAEAELALGTCRCQLWWWVSICWGWCSNWWPSEGPITVCIHSP